jgi:PEGA domain
VTSRTLSLLWVTGIGLLVLASAFAPASVTAARPPAPENVRGLHQGTIGESRPVPSRNAAAAATFSASATGPLNGSSFSVTFNETGLAAGSHWSVTARGNTSTSTTSDIVIQSPPGNFSYTVTIPAGYLGPTQGIYEVTDENTTVILTYNPLVLLTFEEVGLVPGWNWSVTLNGNGTNFSNETRSSESDAITFQEIPGVYNFTTGANTFTALPGDGTASVGTLPSSVTITFVPFPGVLHLAVTPSAAQVWIDGRAIALQQGRYTANLTPGLYSVEALAPGFAPYFNNVSLTRGNETALSISMEPLGGTTGSGLGTSISPLSLAVTVGLLILVGLLLIGVAYYRGQATRIHPPNDSKATATQPQLPELPPRDP